MGKAGRSIKAVFPEKLAQAVARWIRVDHYVKAQWLLNWSHKTCIMEMIEAEDLLREALTGHRGLRAAAKALGCRMPDFRAPASSHERKRAKAKPAQPATRPRARPKLQKRVKSRSIWD